MTRSALDQQPSLPLIAATCAGEPLGDIVRRYVDLVYATARRLVHDGNLADDVTQAAFIVLAKKAGRIDARTLPGWLVNTTRLAAREALRSRHTRHKHETRAAQMRHQTQSHPDEPTVDTILPLLDDALAKLNPTDRSAVTMRFLQGLSFAQVGANLGSSEEAARKRVERAVEKLRAVFLKQGIVPSVGGLMVILATQQSEAAPAAVVAKCTTAAAGSATAGTGAAALAVGVISAMTQANVKLAAVIAIVLLFAGGTGVWVSTRQSHHEVVTAKVVSAQMPVARLSSSGPIKVGVLLSDSTATGISWFHNPFDYNWQKAVLSTLLDPQIELLPIIEPGTESAGELPSLLKQYFPGKNPINGADAAQLRKLDVIVTSCTYIMRDEVIDAIESAVNSGVGLLNNGMGMTTPGYTPAVLRLAGMTQAEYAAEQDAVECVVVAAHPLLGRLTPGTIVKLRPNGHSGTVKGTPLIKVVDDSNILRPLGRQVTGDAGTYPVYLSQLGQGRIAGVEIGFSKGKELDKLTGGRFFIHCIQWLANRPLK